MRFNLIEYQNTTSIRRGLSKCMICNSWYNQMHFTVLCSFCIIVFVLSGYECQSFVLTYFFLKTSCFSRNVKASDQRLLEEEYLYRKILKRNWKTELDWTWSGINGLPTFGKLLLWNQVELNDIQYQNRGRTAKCWRHRKRIWLLCWRKWNHCTWTKDFYSPDEPCRGKTMKKETLSER